MEAKGESKHEITIFWELFNEILSDIKERNYKFNPRAIMVDENGANYCAIRKVFGLDFVTSKVVSCQMHYKNDVNRASLRISDSYRDLFKNICHEMCSITTVGKYNEKKKWLEEIGNIFPQISSWINWWDTRKYHISSFRHFGYCNVTLAESGNSTLKSCMLLWLLEAVHDDTSTMLTQIHEFKSFLTQQTSSSSKGPWSLAHERINIATQICAAKAYTAKFTNKNACSAALEENENPQVFVPSGGVRHRPAKTKTGIEGTFVQTKKQKKSSANKNIHIGLRQQLNEAEDILAEKDVPIDSSPPCSQELPQENFPEVVL